MLEPVCTWRVDAIERGGDPLTHLTGLPGGGAAAGTERAVFARRAGEVDPAVRYTPQDALRAPVIQPVRLDPLEALPAPILGGSSTGAERQPSRVLGHPFEVNQRATARLRAGRRGGAAGAAPGLGEPLAAALSGARHIAARHP